jgi:hypothetical protein
MNWKQAYVKRTVRALSVAFNLTQRRSARYEGLLVIKQGRVPYVMKRVGIIRLKGLKEHIS